MAVVWLFTTFKAYQTIQNKEVTQHRQWMVRSYALAFGAVTLRFWLPLSGIVGIPFMTAYPIIAWLAWIPNLGFAEWWIRKNRVISLSKPQSS